MTTTPTMAEAMRRAVSARLTDLNVALPARVESYDSDSLKVSVQPLIKQGARSEAGEREAVRRPVIQDVPVVFPGSGGVRLKFPIAVGDTVLLVFASGSLDRWLVSGREVDPGDDRQFTLSDAVAIPGLLAFPDAGDAGATIEFTATDKIHLGGPAVFVEAGPTADSLVKASAIDPFTGQTQAVLNAPNLTAKVFAK